MGETGGRRNGGGGARSRAAAGDGIRDRGDPVPYQMEYELTTGDRWVTERLFVRTFGTGWSRTLELTNSPAGKWSIAAESKGQVELPSPGGDPAAVTGALDCDLGLSPLTNTMPVLRGGFLQHGGGEHLMAWVSVPSLVVIPSRQTYRHARPGVVTYSSERFREEIVFGADGLVEDYPSIGRRVRP
ncbi:putative glycolipid-binding domain-containing protein [Nocardia sp. NPDC050435]|uniref:putative glycolipid-binding domain-containing protein n=1 Tax=Nocardia sp. NPDC050435 TaxID=3155040 RepID=UPI0033D01478